MRPFEDEIWDEAQWEAFLRQLESRRERHWGAPEGSDPLELLGLGPSWRRWLELPPEEPPRFAEAEEEDLLQWGPARDPLYQQAQALGAAVLRWAYRQPIAHKDGPFVHFVDQVLQIAARLAAAYGLGWEREVLGGVIAYHRRALEHANGALEGLHELPKRPGRIDRARYRSWAEALLELRNALALRLEALRERFAAGLEGPFWDL
ncbi:MAG: hypothetical protein N2561_06930 [Bacteroidetes bacterium]|nr:hypothetical protein [Rhodothermia bacterium]MCS7154970.1 hypothetical protein [Bacteroidota bacterium]MCX7907254.1 hypothetical protein [Bacteroidota bacterium]MDW8138020.1 hypothetical protein [Bacteroidota bacterium]MDW8286128.1 hypothetical protein [Bacteroidota bacterium]